MRAFPRQAVGRHPRVCHARASQVITQPHLLPEPPFQEFMPAPRSSSLPAGLMSRGEATRRPSTGASRAKQVRSGWRRRSMREACSSSSGRSSPWHGEDYRTDHALPKRDRSCATDTETDRRWTEAFTGDRSPRSFADPWPARCRLVGFGRIAQMVEQLTLNQRVQGSSPCAPTKHFKGLALFSASR